MKNSARFGVFLHGSVPEITYIGFFFLISELLPLYFWPFSSGYAFLFSLFFSFDSFFFFSSDLILAL